MIMSEYDDSKAETNFCSFFIYWDDDDYDTC